MSARQTIATIAGAIATGGVALVGASFVMNDRQAKKAGPGGAAAIYGLGAAIGGVAAYLATAPKADPAA